MVRMWSVRARESSGETAHGIQKSAISGQRKFGGITATIVRTRPFSLSVRPSTIGLALKRRRQMRSLIMTTPQLWS